MLVKDAWQECFKHYLELFFSKNILNMISEIGFVDREAEKKFVKQLRLNSFEDSFDFDAKDINLEFGPRLCPHPLMAHFFIDIYN